MTAPMTLATAAQAADWLHARVAPGAALASDHRALRPGDALLAWPGRVHDARTHVREALAAGAAACLVEAEGAAALALPADPRVAALPALKAAAGAVADAFHGAPSARLDVVAVTGTNGKTSSAWWTAQALSALGRRCGVVGTLGIGLAGADGRIEVEPTGLTTPDAVALHGAFARFVRGGATACAIEASSIGLVEGRLNAARIAVAVFTNLTQDHLDYHGSMAAYGAAKRSLFAWPGLRAAVVNVDDDFGAALADELRAGGLDLWTVTRREGAAARLAAQAQRQDGEGLAFTLAEADAQAPVRTALVGEYNVSNLLGVAAALRALGLTLADVARALAALTPVPGRLQRVPAPDDEVEVLVDYAHPPDALQQVLAALRPRAAARGGALLCLFGCGGNRDAAKRPLMAAIAERGADRVVITSDNPRLEDPQAIVAQVAAGLARPQAAEIVVDRGEAIERAVLAARRGDVLLLAGKGHEDHQDIGGVKRPFSDLAVAAAALRRRAAARTPEAAA
jgi:UDP-N-acetylmuramoyl-L-alanyl-D-glutamate--2,6-diaminopimelate ligase